VGTGLLAVGLLATAVPRVPASTFPPVIELAALDGDNGFVLKGIDANDYAGWAVSGIGDVNGDGLDDVAIGAKNADNGQRFLAGEVYVVFGCRSDAIPTCPPSTAAGTLELSSLNGSNGFVVKGIDRQDFTGTAVSGGDLNGDGLSDLLVGAAGGTVNGTSVGKVYVVYGQVGLGGTGSFNLANLDGSNGFALLGIDTSDGAGSSLSAGDINGDGIDDVVIGAPEADHNGKREAGETYVLFGRSSGFPSVLPLRSLLPAAGGDGSEGFVLNGINAGDNSGEAVATAGDVNNDGLTDLVIGAFGADPAGVDRAGESYVAFGRPGTGTGSIVELSSLDGTNGFAIRGIDPVDFSGGSVSGTGDVNGDGIDDLIIGAQGGDPNGDVDAGEAYILFGSDELGSSGSFDPLTLNGSNGFVVNGALYEGAGWSVSGASDLNGDGTDDIVIGPIGASPGGHPAAGRTYVVFGRSGLGSSGSMALADLDGSSGFAINGVAANDLSGVATDGAGDFNRDGVADLIIGAYNASPNGQVRAGEAYVVYGRPADTDGDSVYDGIDNCTLTANLDQRDTNGDGFGNLCDPDLNDDGIVNFGDLGLLKAVFYTSDTDADFDGDGTVDFNDLATMRSLFFQPPGPSGHAQ
jgi:hypothetical protein